MKYVGIYEAKANLSRLVDQVGKGGEVVITRRGKPVARLLQAAPAQGKHSAEVSEDIVAKRRQALTEIREMARKRGVRISHEEIKSRIEEGRH